MDLDTLSPKRLDDFDYAITTRAAYQSTPPPNFKEVVRTASYVLWRRTGATPPLQVHRRGRHPGPRARLRPAPQGRRLPGRGGDGDRAPRAGGRRRPAAGAGAARSRPRGRATPEPRPAAPGAGSSRSSTTARCRSTVSRRRVGGRAAAVAGRHVPDPPGAGRVLAGGRGARPRWRPGRRSPSTRREPSALAARCWASAGRSGWGRWPPPGRAPQQVAAARRLRALRRPLHRPARSPRAANRLAANLTRR